MDASTMNSLYRKGYQLVEANISYQETFLNFNKNNTHKLIY